MWSQRADRGGDRPGSGVGAVAASHTMISRWPPWLRIAARLRPKSRSSTSRARTSRWSRGRGVEHAPQGFLAQPDIDARPQRIERLEGDRPGLIPRRATPLQARGRVALEPTLALAVADKNPGRGESCVPGRRCRLSPATAEPASKLDGRESRDRHLGTERLEQDIP